MLLATTGRLAVETARVLGHPGVVTVRGDAAEAFTGVDYVFSAIRVGGDRGRVIDERRAGPFETHLVAWPGQMPRPRRPDKGKSE